MRASGSSRAASVGLVGALAALVAACGGGGGDGDGGGNDAAADTAHGPCSLNVCNCADRGPPDYSREMAGMAPGNADPMQAAGLVRANHWRTSAGLPALNENSHLNQAATAHSTFMANNPYMTCWPGVHNEVASCMGFTGAGPGDRETAAGYSFTRASEVIDWNPDPTSAVDGWIWTVYHRLPFMDASLADVGYGHVMGHAPNGQAAINQVMDFGTSSMPPPAPAMPIAVFPVPGQTMVVTSFDGSTEGPTPPMPSTGWPSGTVVSAHFAAPFTVTEHHLFYNAHDSCQEVMTTYLSQDTDMTLAQFGAPVIYMYANQHGLLGHTEYVASITGTINGQAFTKTWAFTTM